MSGKPKHYPAPEELEDEPVNDDSEDWPGDEDGEEDQSWGEHEQYDGMFGQ